MEDLGLGEAEGFLGGEAVQQPQELIQLLLQTLRSSFYKYKYIKSVKTKT